MLLYNYIKQSERKTIRVKKEIIRNPTQARSIEKRKKILDAGLRLIGQKGFYHTTTADIAREAGVSTGIVYRYFENKKDIFITAFSEDIGQMSQRFLLLLEKLTSKEELKERLVPMLHFFADYVKSRINTGTYKESFALILQDSDFYEMMNTAQNTFIEAVRKTMVRIGYPEDFSREKSFLVCHIVDHLCDDLALNENSILDKNYIIEKTAKMLIFLLETFP